MLAIILFLLLPSVAMADVYVISASDNSVYSLSEQDDALIPKGYTKTIIKGNIANLPISGDVSMYDFKKGAFVINAAKVKASQDAQGEAIAKQTAIVAARASAITKLTDAITKVEPKDVLTDQELNALLSS